jgi:hypothetical protein
LEGSERSAADRIKNGVTHGDLLIANVQAHLSRSRLTSLKFG